MQVLTPEGCFYNSCVEFKNPLNSTIAHNDFYSCNKNESIVSNLFENDEWYEPIVVLAGQNKAVLSLLTSSSNAEVEIITDVNCSNQFCRLMQYTPNNGFIGLDSVEYELCINDWCDTAKVFINVEGATTNSSTLSKPTFKVFPNPSNEQLTIDLSDFSVQNVSLYNLNGKKVYTNSANLNDFINIATNNLSSGLYLLKIETNEGDMLLHKIEIMH